MERARGQDAALTFEGTRSIGLVVPKQKEADDNEEVDYLPRVTFHVEDEGVRNCGRGSDDHDYLHIQQDYLAWKWEGRRNRRTEGIK